MSYETVGRIPVNEMETTRSTESDNCDDDELFHLPQHVQTQCITIRKHKTSDLQRFYAARSTLPHLPIQHELTDKSLIELSIAETSLISTKTMCAWYILITFIIQHTLIGLAWYSWSPSNGNHNISNVTYWFYWLLISVQFVLFMYYPFYTKIVLNSQILVCNSNRKSLCLWKLCLCLELLHIFYLCATTLIIPSLCLLHEYANAHEPLFWCPVNDELLFFNPSSLSISLLISIGLCFAFLSILVLLYMIYLDLKLYKIWQIENPSNYRLRTMTMSSMRMTPHPELPNDDPYNLEMQPSDSSDSDM
eukprot:CAMPEP_0197051116 /NCGR_PEP_ID=MMETSP1384-20130603/25851_1 /TAXON_ID=29189 /ORGANISM="Ammonia sp." /LENGTH=305 /DNA_ID=CAMNT_0042483627 /DNA_START=55 /DNA_END=972 /DNA_ORIENTATION=-